MSEKARLLDPDHSVYDKVLRVDPASLGEEAFLRADLVIHDVDHSAASFETRVFFNNPEAAGNPAADPERGYAGSFAVFGHAGCGGDPGHCDFVDRPADDPRGSHHMRPHDFTVIVTKALRRLFERGQVLEHVTLVPVRPKGPEMLRCGAGELRFSDLELRLYR